MWGYHRSDDCPSIKAQRSFAEARLLGWRPEPPDKSGMWWVRQKNKKHEPPIVQVQKRGRSFMWSFIDGLTWNRCDEYPQYEWCGPIVPPS